MPDYLPFSGMRSAPARLELVEVAWRMTASPRTVTVHHAIIHRALKKATKERLLVRNPAADVEHRARPTHTDRREQARQHCWSASEARAFLEAAKATTPQLSAPQLSAFYTLALDSGARKSELHGLTWDAIDLEAGAVTIRRQLDKAGAVPVFGPTKTDRARTVSLGAETIARLHAHKRTKAAIKMANRTTYQDFGLVFAKEYGDLHGEGTQLGQPLRPLGAYVFHKLVVTAGVRRIKFHGLRHTTATLLLQAGIPAHVVAQRLGHAQVAMTLDVYAHVLPAMQQEAASKLAAALYG